MLNKWILYVLTVLLSISEAFVSRHLQHSRRVRNSVTGRYSPWIGFQKLLIPCKMSDKDDVVASRNQLYLGSLRLDDEVVTEIMTVNFFLMPLSSQTYPFLTMEF